MPVRNLALVEASDGDIPFCARASSPGIESEK
jgi:hypothetical protein